jgi:hypothetical protein
MKRMYTLFAAASAAVPLIVAAQTANTPGGEAATGSGLDQTKNAPQKTTPKTTQTAPDATNPSGTLPSKDTKASRHALRRDAAKTETGDVPTYPAPARDGTPTK